MDNVKNNSFLYKGASILAKITDDNFDINNWSIYLLSVVVLPNHGPHIAGNGKQYYMIGDEINLNCTSAKSYPASILHWYINDQQVCVIL